MKIDIAKLNKLSIADLEAIKNHCFDLIRSKQGEKDHYMEVSGHCIINIEKRIDEIFKGSNE